MLGLASALLGVFYFLYVMAVRLFTESAIPGWTSVVAVVLLLGGMQLACIGVIGQYLGRMYDEIQTPTSCSSSEETPPSTLVPGTIRTARCPTWSCARRRTTSRSGHPGGRRRRGDLAGRRGHAVDDHGGRAGRASTALDAREDREDGEEEDPLPPGRAARRPPRRRRRLPSRYSAELRRPAPRVRRRAGRRRGRDDELVRYGRNDDPRDEEHAEGAEVAPQAPARVRRRAQALEARHARRSQLPQRGRHERRGRSAGGRVTVGSRPDAVAPTAKRPAESDDGRTARAARRRPWLGCATPRTPAA